MVEDLNLAPLFDDNPAVKDLLGFTGVAHAVTRVLRSGGLDPVTVGIQGAWGGGKSTVLNLVDQELQQAGEVLVVRVDPWEFDDIQDVRGTLIALVLDALQEALRERLGSGEDISRWESVKAKLNDLRKRIAWGRVATVLVTSAATMTPDIAGLVEALTPADPDDEDAAARRPQTMAGFREDLAALLATEDLGVSKVVVLVDDLDRCLPAAAVATLEAIKLFLSVPKMAFVIAADEDLVRASVDKHLDGLRNGQFAALYTEKIVQLPISLPVLTQADTEAYIALLLCAQNSQLTGQQQDAVVARARERRREGRSPYVISSEEIELDPEAVIVAASVSAALFGDTWRTPRAVKRFLNNLSVRQHIARDAGVDLPLGMLTRMYVLELRHPREFKALIELSAGERAALLPRWEMWATGASEDSGDEPVTKPDQVDELTRAWAATKPSLAGREGEIDRYLSFAASLRSDVRIGGALDAGQRALLELLLEASDTVREEAVQRVLAEPLETQQALVTALVEQLPRLDEPEGALEALTEMAAGNTALAEDIAAAIRTRAVLASLQAHHVPLLVTLPGVRQAILDAHGLDEQLVAAARAHQLPS